MPPRPLHQNLGVIRTLFDSANSLTSTEENKTIEVQNIKAALRVCNYPDCSFEKVEQMVREKTDEVKKKSKDSNAEGKKNIKLVVVS